MQPIGTFGEIRIKINLTIAVLSIAIGGGLIVLYTLYPAQKDFLVFCAAVIAGVTGIYSAFYVGQTLRTQIERDKLHRSFELTGEYTSIDFTKENKGFKRPFSSTGKVQLDLWAVKHARWRSRIWDFSGHSSARGAEFWDVLASRASAGQEGLREMNRIESGGVWSGIRPFGLERSAAPVIGGGARAGKPPKR